MSYTTNRIPAQGGGGPEVDDGQTSRGGIPLSPDGSVERQGEGETQPQGVTAGETAPFSDWQDISTAPLDGTDILIVAHGMIVEARFHPGEWNHSIDGSEYDGPVWVCFDDAFQFEIEETGPSPEDLHHGPVTLWAPKPVLPAPPEPKP